jgi:hypothetical protein
LLREICARTIADGVIACVVFDADTGKPTAGLDHGTLECTPAMFDILLSIAPVRSAEPEAVEATTREALLVEAHQTAFACVTRCRKWVVLIVAPNSFSVTLGWSLLRRVAAAAEVAA